MAAENLKGDRALFGSLLTHVVRASPDEDCASLILKTVGRAVEADRCYAYRFWEPGKSSMCTNTHEWCADGIEPMISGQQTCDLSELEEFNACITSGRDYIAIHSADGVHRLLFPGEELRECPGRCEECSFYKLLIPPVEDADHIIELKDAKGQAAAVLPPDCPAKSLEVAVVYCDGKPWGGIALHYVTRQQRISDEDRSTLKTAADVLTLALERHSAALRLKAERDRVVEAEKARSYFFSSVSHDIRTPLNAIIGFSDLPRRVLVVDDSPVNRAVLKAMLKKVGITDLELAVDGRAALDVLERDQSFDLVLSDMWMPVMDGAELIRRIRGEERLAHLKVCSISADVESLATYREQGFDALLLKPVTVEKLAELLKNPDLRSPA